MTPGARVAAAIEILDAIKAGQPTEQALTRWARNSRFAGSKDRAAVRDHVFDIVRHWRSDAVRGGAETGRGRMIGRLRAQGVDPDTLFNGVGHSPEPLTDHERAVSATPSEQGDIWDLPDWLIARFKESLGDPAESSARALTERAPVNLRVNTLRASRADVQRELSGMDIVSVPNPRAETALTVTDGARRIRNCSLYTRGVVELQDAASQAAVECVAGTGRVLDFCAGGGGKSLALDAAGWRVTAHDVNAARMRDLPARAARGGHDIAICLSDELAQIGLFDAVFCDAPCSGSGAWRRSPAAKWALTPDDLRDLASTQGDILDAARSHVTPEGVLYYATCSLLKEENEAQIDAFCDRHSDWHCTAQQRWPVDEWGDGFFLATLTRIVK